MTEAETNPPEHYMGFQSVTEAETERAAIVAWLWGLHWTNVLHGPANKIAAAIERGEHKRAADNGAHQ